MCLTLRALGAALESPWICAPWVQTHQCDGRCDYILRCARGFCSLYKYTLTYHSNLTGGWIMPVHLNTNEIMSVIVLASTGTFPKCPEGGKVGLLVFQTSRHPGSWALPACQLLCCKRSQPCAHCFISKAAAQGMWVRDWSQEQDYREPLPAGRSWAQGKPGVPFAAHLCQKTRSAAFTGAGGLQKLVLMLEGLLDFKIKT